MENKRLCPFSICHCANHGRNTRPSVRRSQALPSKAGAGKNGWALAGIWNWRISIRIDSIQLKETVEDVMEWWKRRIWQNIVLKAVILGVEIMFYSINIRLVNNRLWVLMIVSLNWESGRLSQLGGVGWQCFYNAGQKPYPSLSWYCLLYLTHQ